MSHRIRNAGLIGIALLTVGAGLVGACKNGDLPEPNSTYELALEKLDPTTAEHWRGVERNYNSEQAIDELAFLPEEGRLVLADDIKAYTSDGNISGKELSDLADVDVDGVINSKDAYPMDPSNKQEISQKTFSFVRDLVKYRNSISDERILPEIYSGLERIINIVESNPELIRDFSSLHNHILTSLVSGIPEIAKYPQAMRLGAIQVDSQNLADEYAMEKFVIPAIGYIVRLQDEGMIDALNGLGIPDAALEAEGIRQILLPIELREVNILTGERLNILTGERHMRPDIETGIYNVTFDESLGKSPQEWLGEIAVRDYNDKNLVVWEWIKEYPAEYGPRGPWSNSAKVYAEYLKSVDDLVLFIRDYPTYLRGPPSNNLVPELTEQTAPYYSVLLGRGFGEAVFDVIAKYPTDAAGKFKHSEAFILTKNTSDSWLLPYRFGFWLERQAFIDDYKDKPYNTPHAEVRRANGTYEVINFNQNLTQQKK